MERSALAKSQAENVQPAYAEGFGVAGAHLSRRSESEGGTSNSERFRSSTFVWLFVMQLSALLSTGTATN